MLPPTAKVKTAPSGNVRHVNRKSSNEENLLDDDDKMEHCKPVHESGFSKGV